MNRTNFALIRDNVAIWVSEHCTEQYRIEFYDQIFPTYTFGISTM